MIWSGHAGLWEDWVKFQAQASVQRKREEAEAEAFIIEFHNNIGKSAIAIAIILVISGLIYLKTPWACIKPIYRSISKSSF